VNTSVTVAVMFVYMWLLMTTGGCCYNQFTLTDCGTYLFYMSFIQLLSIASPNLAFWGPWGPGASKEQSTRGLISHCTSGRLLNPPLGIAQLVAQAAGESILCVRGDDVALSKLLWDFLLFINPW